MTPKLCIIATLLGSAACTQNDSSMLILQNQVPGPKCVVSAAPTNEFISVGKIDTGASEGYVFTPLVKSLAAASDSSSSGRRIFVHGADVDLADTSGGKIVSFSQTFSGYIGPSGTTSFGFIIIPKATLATLGEQEVIATVKVFGELDGGEVESQPFQYPVDVCTGCLQNDLGPCSSLTAGFMPQQGGACQLLQDGVVDCCENGTTLVCPAVPAVP